MPLRTAVDGAPSASVIILNYNGLRFLDPCLKALRNQEVEGGFEVLLVDNASTDDSVAYVREHYDWIQVVESTVNLGFAGGNNLGFRMARGR